jgi:hypothetical protein
VEGDAAATAGAETAKASKATIPVSAELAALMARKS